MRIGFVGYSAGKYDVKKAQEIIDTIFNDINKKYQNVEIVSGATYMGIPGQVYEKASEYSFKTIGFMCKEGYDCVLYPCDEIYAIGDNWGDESSFFITDIDMLYRIGGGKQSLEEVKVVKNLGKPVIEYELPEIK